MVRAWYVVAWDASTVFHSYDLAFLPIGAPSGSRGPFLSLVAECTEAKRPGFLLRSTLDRVSQAGPGAPEDWRISSGSGLYFAMKTVGYTSPSAESAFTGNSV